MALKVKLTTAVKIKFLTARGRLVICNKILKSYFKQKLIVCLF